MSSSILCAGDINAAMNKDPDYPLGRGRGAERNHVRSNKAGNKMESVSKECECCFYMDGREGLSLNRNLECMRKQTIQKASWG